MNLLTTALLSVRQRRSHLGMAEWFATMRPRENLWLQPPLTRPPIQVSSTSSDRTPLSQFRAPRYWPTWLGLWILWLLARLPFPVQIQLGKGIGLLSYLFARRRRNIGRINLELCFPELTARQRRQLLRRTFLSNGIGVMEAAMSWCRDPGEFRDRVSVRGLEHLREARNEGRGVLLICAHFTTLEFAGALLSLFEKMDVTYRKHKNPLFEAVMTNSRKRIYPAVIERENVREVFRSLKKGHIVWYAPDQDYGPRHSVFVPFSGWRLRPSQLPPASPGPTDHRPFSSPTTGWLTTPVTSWNSADPSRTIRVATSKPMRPGSTG